MEVLNSIDYRNERIHDTEKPAVVPAQSVGPFMETQETLPHNLTEHQGGLEFPLGDILASSPDMSSHLVPAQTTDDSLKDKAGFATSANKIESNNVSENGSTPKAERKSKEDKMNHHDNVAATSNNKPATEIKSKTPHRGLVDTAAPFESVREAVTKFGGIVDWKAYKSHTLERRRVMQLEFENVQHDIPLTREDLEAAEMARSQVVKELEKTKRFIEELKHKLEKAQIEVDQAKQDSELAHLRAQEMDQGIDGEASIIAQTQLSVANGRHQKAIEELKFVKGELKSTHEKHTVLACERDKAVKRAEGANFAAKETEVRVEELTLELIASKESLELAHTAHHEAEDHRLGSAMAKEQDCLSWEKELHQAYEELRQLNEKLLFKTSMESKHEKNVVKLLSLNTDLDAYMLKKPSEEDGVLEEHGSGEAKKISRSIKQALASVRKELEGVKGSIEKTTNEANLIRVTAESLMSELDREKASLVALQQMESMASITVSSLEAELIRTKQEIEVVYAKEAEAREKMVVIPKMLQQAAQEADDAKVSAHLAHEVLRKCKEEAEQTKASAATAEIRLSATFKEIEASKASERLALVAAHALQDSEDARSVEDSPRGVTLPISEYYTLSKMAHEAEEIMNKRMMAALEQIELAKESESRSLEKLQDASREMDQKKNAHEMALLRADRAEEGKLGAEQLMRKWRSEHGQLRRAHEAAKHAVKPLSTPFTEDKGSYPVDEEVIAVSKPQISDSSMAGFILQKKLQKKKSFFLQMSTLLSRKAHTQK